MALAEEMAARSLESSSNVMLASFFRAMAGAFKAAQGPAFKLGEFTTNVGNLQLNRIRHTGEGGFSLANGDVGGILRIAAAGVFTDLNFIIAAPSDRFRLILGLKLTVYALDDMDVIGAVQVPAPQIDQLIAGGMLNINRQRGTAILGSFWQFCTGAQNTRLAINTMDAATILAQPHIPSENEILPQGINLALATPIDALNPKERTQFQFQGLNQVAFSGAYADDLGIAVDAIVLDGVASGQ